jgi:O-antigen ligase
MRTTNIPEPKSHYVQSSGINITLSLLVIITIFTGILSGLLAARLGLDAIFVIAAIVGFLLLFLDTYRGLFVVVIALPLLVGHSPDVSISEQAFAVLFGAWFLGWVARWLLDRSGKLNFGWHPVAKPVLAMGTLLAFGAIIGLLNGAALTDMFRDFSLYAGYFIVLPVAGVVRSRKTAWRLFKIVALIGLPFFIWTSFVWWARKFGIEHGFGIVLAGAAYAGPIIGMLWPMLLLRTGRRKQLLALFGLSLLLLFAIGSGYRSMILAMLVMSCVAVGSVWVIQAGKQRMRAVVPLIVGVAFLFWVIGGIHGYLPLPGGDRTRTIYASMISPQMLLQDLSFQGRLLEAQAALEAFREHPIIGQGLGHRLEHLWWNGEWVQSAFTLHISYPEILMEFGIIGALVFAWYFGSILRFAFVVAKKADNHLVKAVALGIIAWIIVNLIPTVGSLSNMGFTFVVGLMAGILPALAGSHPYALEKASAKSFSSSFYESRITSK